MTSQLASQLQKLQTRPEGDKHLNESFLFSKGDARSFSREQIHQLATNGLQTLITLDNRFHPFIHDLFDPQKARQERKLLHAEESRRLDMKLEHLLTLLSPHLFLTAAQQVFEYLVRVHEVHVYNVSAVLRAFLPYHDHNIFSRAILLLDLRDTGFDFLSKNQERGAPLLREHLVLACAESRKALRTVCMTAAMPYRLGVQNSAANALFASVATSLARHTDAEALWRVLLPFVVEFLQGAEAVVKADDATELAGEQPQWWSEGTATATSHGADREVVCTALLVLAAWSAEATFSLQMMRTVMRPIVGLLRNPSGSAGVPLGDLLTLVDLLFSSQLSVVSQVGFAPLLHTLVAAPWAQWSATLSESLFLEADRAGVTPLPSLLSALTHVALHRLRMAHSLTSVPAEVLDFLRCAAEQLPLTDSLVMRFLEVVMECEAVLASKAGEEGVEENKKGKKTTTAASKEGPSAFLEHIVAGLERRYQRVFDATLSRALSGETTAEAAKSFLARHLGGTRYQMLEVSTHGGAGKERLPLFACLLHTVPEVRKAAAASMEAMSLAQLCATSAVGETGGSILELLAHAAQYESDNGVAGQFLKTGAAALRQLSAAVSSSETSTATGRNEEEEAEEEREGLAKDAKERQFHLAAVSGLLRALYTMVTALSAELQQIFFETILQPLSAAPAVGPAAVKRAAKGGKKAKGNKAAVEPEKDAGAESPVRAHALYYTTLLYVRAASTASGEAAGTANEEEEEGSALASTPLVRAMTNALLKEFPEIPKTGAVLKASAAATGDVSHQRKGTGRHRSDASSSSDDDEDNATAAERQTHKTSATTGDKKELSFLAVLEYAPLLQGISAVAETRLRAALQTSLALLDDDASSPVQRRRAHVECAVAAAAMLLAAPAQQHSLLQFLLGQGEGTAVEQGYLHQLQKRDRTLARQGAAHGHGAGTAAPVVGRGAKNSLLSSAYLPGDDLTACLAAAVEGVVRVTLGEGNMTGTELVPLLRLLGFLGARLPTLSESPVALPAALLTLVDAPTTALAVSGANESEEAESAPRPEDENAFGVDWYALVHAAVYGPAEQRVAEATASTGTFSLGALAACLFLPLRAPSSHRVKALQQLQDAILRGMAGKPAANGASCVHLVVATALAATRTTKTNTDASLPPMDVTALSSVVEAMAKEESRFSITEGGAALVCALLATAQKEGQVAPVVPYNLAADVVELLFAPPDAAGGKKASLHLATLWPQLERLITAAAGSRPTASSGGKSRAPVVAGDSDVSVAGARYVEAVCRRVTLQPTAGPVACDPAVQLCLLLLRRPFLRVAGTASVRPVYRAALSALATALQQGVEAPTQSSLIFRKGGSETGAGKKNGKGSSSSADAKKFAEALADIIRPLMVEATGVIGSDVARLCVGTVGGFQRLFRPFLANCSSAAASSAAASTGLSATDGEALVSFLEVLAPESSSSSSATAVPSGGRWLPPSDCVLSNPLTFADASTIVAIAKPSVEGLASSGKSSKGKGGKAAAQAAQDTWPRGPSSLMCLRVLSALLKAAPAVQFDDDEDAESLLALAMSILSTHPLDKMLPLLLPSTDSSEEATLALATADGGSGSLLDVYPRHVLAFLRALTALCTEQPRALAEKDPRGAYKLRGAVLKQALVLMASLLLQSNDEDADGAAAAAADISRGKVDVIAELLRTLAPLLGPLQDGLPTGKTEKAAPSFLLHIPIAALLVRLSAVEFSEALRYRSAADTCREIITSFDVHTQISTVTQLMRLVVDPHAVLAVASENEAEGNGQDEETEDAREVLHLFRKMVKPNQIVNRQEQLLDVITTTVKSDAFLTPFIQLQHHSGKKAGSGKQKTGEEEAAEEEEHDEATAAQHGAEGTNASDACMHLLLSALEMFSHYSDLNTATENDAEDGSAAAKDSGALYGENKSYAMLLELLAGNALACVLAGINEPTFVECQQRLLGDSRSTLQLKGLEVLLDRLHHSLPTVENTLSDEELEQHRRDLRDPKKKLTLADLVRVKARPLTTKRSFQLMPHLMTLLQAAQAGALSTTRKAAQSYTAPAIPMPALVQLFRIVQLSVAAVEELIRIVASGGSTQAEKTLLNTNRGRRVTEAQLSKLFGNKARVQQVHDFVKYVFELGMPSLSQGLQTLLRSARRSTFDAAGSSGESDQTMYAFKATAEEGIIAAMCGLLTALGTVAQVMGAAFSSTHCIALLNTTVSAVVFQVADLPAVVARGEAGSLLRHTSLSCLIRVFPLCWQLSQPYLPRIIYAASHSTNVDDPETSYLCAEVLAVLEALMEPQLFLDSTAECLRGMRHVNTAVLPGGAAPMDATTTGAKNARVVRVQATTHSFVLLFGCIARRVQSLRKEELLMMSVMTEGTTPQDNFWLAALQSLAGTANAAPSAEVVLPVLDAYTVFFLKFKPKHCTKFLRVIAEWAFGGDANHFSKSLKKGSSASKRANSSNTSSSDNDEEEHGGTGAQDNADSVPRTSLHGWGLFYALYNHLLEKLGGILDFSFPTVLPYVVGTLNGYCSSAKDGGAKQLASLVAVVLEGALDSVRRMSLAQTPGPDYDYSIPLDVFFATDEVFPGLMGALTHQLSNVAYLADELHDYRYRAEHMVIPAIRAFFACLNASKLQSKTQAELVRALRHPSRHVRRMALLCLDGVYADGGEELASRLMAEMLPSVVELTEDRDDAVVEEARKLCTNLSHMTGQDVLHAMS